MSALILNRETFSLPDDGWYQLAPLGEFPHGDSGVVQVVDAAACEAMAVDFREKSQGDNFAGVLIDFDHFSLDAGSRSEAAGWIVGLEARKPVTGHSSLVIGEEESETKSSTGGGLWAKIRWSDLGEAAVSGGRYRFLSPVWARSDCEDLGNGRIRPVRLLNAAVTNDPNLKGMVPLSNRGQTREARGQVSGVEELLRNVVGAKRLKWVLGDSPEDRHCPSCEALAGQVHTAAEWSAAGIEPKDSGLYCQGHCHCRLVETADAVSGSLAGVPLRREEEDAGDTEVENRSARGWGGGSFRGHGKHKLENRVMGKELENIGWTDEARAASLAVRQAKAARRGGEEPADEDERDDGGWRPSKEEIREKLRKGEVLSDEERDYLDGLMRDGYAGDSDSDPIYEWMERRAEEPDYSEERGGGEEKDSWERIEDTAKRLMEKERRGEKMTPDEEAWLKRFRDFHKKRDEGIIFDKHENRSCRGRRAFLRKGLHAGEAVAEA